MSDKTMRKNTNRTGLCLDQFPQIRSIIKDPGRSRKGFLDHFPICVACHAPRRVLKVEWLFDVHLETGGVLRQKFPKITDKVNINIDFYLRKVRPLLTEIAFLSKLKLL